MKVQKIESGQLQATCTGRFLALGLLLLLIDAVSSTTAVGAPLQATGLDPRTAPLSRSAVSTSWEEAVRLQLADAEYEITWQDETVLVGLDAGWQAPNRAQGVRTYFTESGIRVVPRMDETPTWEWALGLAAWGRVGGAESESLEAAQERVDGARIEYDRGGIVEWYVNDRRGLEQGFTIPAPPLALRDAGSMDRKGEGERVRIDLALGGTLDPVFSEDGQAVDFVTAAGVKVVHYAALVVRDAAGKRLRAWMEGFSGPGTLRGIRIVFEDGDAIYPVSVDPLATTPAWMVEGDQADARLGNSVATAGDVNGDGYSDVIVGAYWYDNGQMDEGRTYVYLGSAAGPSTTPAWSAESNQVGAQFGWVAATAGDVNGDGYSDVLVGAGLYDNGQSNEGRAFLYRGSATGLAATPAWTAELDIAGAWFASSLGTAGDVNGDGYSDVIVGAYGEERADMYLGSAAGLAAQPAWTSWPSQSASQYGISVSTAGDVNGDGYSDVIVGSDLFTNGQSQEGRAFVFYGSATGLLVNASWVAEINMANARFGYCVSTAGDVNGDGYAEVLVGALAYANGQVSEGRAHLYMGSSGGLSATPNWTVEGNQTFAATGFSLSTAGDVNGDGYADVIVGTAGLNGDLSGEGQAAVYLGSPVGLSTAPSWTVEGNAVGAKLGYSVGTAGDVNGDGYSDVIVGAPFYTNDQTSEGRAFLYLGSASGLASSAGWTSSGSPTNAGAHFGAAVETAGDVNGDGFADVIVGAPLFDGGMTDEGRAFLFLGSSSGLAFSPQWSLEGNQSGAEYGASVGTAGDVNGDGFDDVIVGAPFFDAGQPEEGKTDVYYGSGGGLSTSVAWTMEGNQSSGNFGASVGTAGDVNGDGFADVIVGAPHSSSGQLLEGLAFIYHGSATGLPAVQSSYLDRNQSGAAFGTAVGTAGDVDGDGFSDVIIGAPLSDNGQNNEGRAFVYRGSVTGLVSLPAWTTESDQADAEYGDSVGTAGDVNGDGYSDVIVGSPRFDNGQTDEGRAYVYLGSMAGLPTTPAWTAESDQAGARFGASVGTAGDVNGDGYADVVVGADLYSNFQSTEGRAFAYHGSAAGLSTSAAWGAGSNQAAAQAGYAVATAGDVNGDGYADVIVGAPFYDIGQPDEGRASIYYGNGGPGLSVRPRQLRFNNTVPVARLGASEESDGFRLALLGRSPFGRGNVKLEWEVKGLGTLLNGASTHLAGSWSDSGTGGASLNHAVTDPVITAGAPLHWRVRLIYRRSSAPFQTHGRWLTVPWSGWNESMLRAAYIPAGRVPDDATGDQVHMTKVAGGQIRLDWAASCLPTDTDYEVYEGTISGNFASHLPRLCSTSGALTATLTPSPGLQYYLVVPRNAASEGSYGTTSGGAERPQGPSACLHQEFQGCQMTCVGGRFPGAPCSGPSGCPGACSGAHNGQSCLDTSECLGRCQQDQQMSCGAGVGCGACANDHSIRCMSGFDCAAVGGMCNSFGPCNGVGACGNPPPGTCVGP